MKTVEEAEKELEAFIKANPRAVLYQEEINKTLKNTPVNSRLEVLTIMICCKFAELQENLTRLAV